MRGKKGGRGKKGRGSGSGSGYGISILMRGVRTEGHIIREDDVKYERNEFYRIDIKKSNSNGEISICAKKWFDSQLDCDGYGCKLIRAAGGSRIYSLANVQLMESFREIPEYVRGIHCLKSVAWVDLNDKPNPKKWKSGPSLAYYGFPLEYAALGDNIYNLATGYLSVPAVLDTATNNDWVVCTPDKSLEMCQVTPNVLPDPANKRIIVQLTTLKVTSPVIYAWHPEDDPPHWDIITKDIDVSTWSQNYPTLVDDVVFFHTPNLFSAYHLQHKKWIRVSLSKSHSWPPHLVYRQIDHMFYLGDSRLCLVYTHRILDDIEVFKTNPHNYVLGVNVFLDVFLIQPDKSNPLHINIAHSFTKSIFFDDLFGAAEFLPLGAYFDD